ncbi:hypothetical protein FA15DRAFT_507773 [Coprinopsis marcescibilis]|uniref:F-box domain-containing protein n=1 Tax=Coprinopsis marcescibilis TaxID=230819 RepID=A0A5C3L7M3_COPMA|nr:hypothetical protein FA15DRAFT_507773 [Coprinopsis marcescibilis]
MQTTSSAVLSTVFSPEIPRSARDQVLHNDDLLDMIFRDMYENSPDPESARKQILPLCVTSRAFFEAASNWVWRELGGLLPLVKLLPGLENLNGTYYLSRALSFFDMTRWITHARRVQVLNLTSQSVYDISAQVYVALALFQGSSNNSLLPALRELRYDGRINDNTLACFPIVLSSSLEKVAITEHQKSVSLAEHSAAALAYISQAAKNLRHLSLRHINNQTPSALCKKIATMKHLESLKLEIAYNWDHIRSFKFFQRLKSFRMELFHHPSEPVFSGTWDQRENQITVAGRFADTTQCLRLALAKSSTDALNITIRSPEGMDESGWVSLATTLMEVGSSLLKLDISSPFHTCAFPLNVLLEPSTLANLQHLGFTGIITCGPGSFREAEVFLGQLLASGGSKQRPLQSLYIPGIWNGCDPGLQCLEHVADHAPALCALTISVDSSRTLYHELKPWMVEGGATSAGLERLTLHDCRKTSFEPQDFVRVPRLLHNLFPKLSSLTVYCGSEADQQAGWKVIEQLREEYQELRELRKDP